MAKPSEDEIIKLSNEVYHRLCSMGANPQDAKEIVQESLYRAFLHIDGIEAASFRAWVYKVAINQYYDLCRRTNRFPTTEIDEQLYKSVGSIEDDLLGRERKGELNRAMSELKPLERGLIQKKYEEGYSYKEISSSYQMKESQVKTYLYRARKKLAKLIRREEL
ncbi:RNA polymerase sigma factor [Bacillus sp. FJAT-45037]|uniref:RNA polymerase sigma factor n=1 Tax=Bacillus sp. FJAT-45037 TaxID=2011007 RepID=UPI000C24D62D|nr:RNA polymerase sigma factor [Bacillus sp. FJAT-45037]